MLNINRKVFENARANVDQERVATAAQAFARCKDAMDSTDCNVICCHTCSGFDELALLRDQLLHVAMLSGPSAPLVSDPLQAVWEAAKQLPDHDLPAFLGALDLCHYVHKVLFECMEQEPGAEDAVRRAREAGYRTIPATLDRAYQVCTCLTWWLHCMHTAMVSSQASREHLGSVCWCLAPDHSKIFHNSSCNNDMARAAH